MNCKVPGGESEALVAAVPTLYYSPAYLARHGWVGLRLDVAAIDWKAVEELASTNYRLTAPKRLASRV